MVRLWSLLDAKHWSGFKMGLICGIPIGAAALLFVMWFALAIAAPAIEYAYRYSVSP